MTLRIKFRKAFAEEDFLDEVLESVEDFSLFSVEMMEEGDIRALIMKKKYINFVLYFQLTELSDQHNVVDVTMILSSTGSVEALETAEAAQQSLRDLPICPSKIVQLLRNLDTFLTFLDKKITEFEERIGRLIQDRWVLMRRLYIRVYEAEGFAPAFAACYQVLLPDDISFEFRYDSEHRKLKYAVSIDDFDLLAGAVSSIGKDVAGEDKEMGTGR